MTAPRPAIEPGTVFHGTYEIVRPIGAGGMGVVYEALHARLPGRFAIKVLHQEVTRPGAEDVLRFRREAEIASSLRHPNIVQVVDFNQMDDGSPYIVMELIDGVDLGTELERAGRFSVERAAAITAQIASALSAAHAKGIVHRDLKPQNILLVPLRGSEGDFAKVVDFGISKVLTSATVTGDSTLLGTPQYMAPEQARGRPDEVDGRTDQFALAALAYEMVAGRGPFAADSIPSALFKIMNAEPPALPDIREKAAVEAVLRKGLSKQKNDRYSTILEFSDDLTAAIKGEPLRVQIEARRPRVDPSAPTLRKPDAGAMATTERGTAAPPGASRRRVPWLIATGLLVLGAPIVVLLAQSRRSTGPSDRPAAPARSEAASARARSARTSIEKALARERAAMEKLVVKAASTPQLVKGMRAGIDSATVYDLLSNEEWWRPQRDMGVYCCDLGGTSTSVGLDDVPHPETWMFRTLDSTVSGWRPRAAIFAGFRRAYVVATAFLPKKLGKLLVARPLDGQLLRDLAAEVGATLIVSDGRNVLGLSETDPATRARALALVGREAAGGVDDPSGAAVALSLGPDVWLWVVVSGPSGGPQKP